MQDVIRKLPGVISARVGYTGGDVPNATYRNHSIETRSISLRWARLFFKTNAISLDRAALGGSL
jgi:peptide methionine sulfoxide reductase MsrA